MFALTNCCLAALENHICCCVCWIMCVPGHVLEKCKNVSPSLQQFVDFFLTKAVQS